MSQFSKDIDSLSVKGAEKLDSATFDRISGYIQSGKIRAEDVDSLSKGVQHVDSAAFDRISKAIERENVQSPVQEKPKTAGDQLLEFSNKVATAVSPRFMKMSNIDNVSDFGRGLLSTGLDIASLGPRAAVSTLATPLDLITDTYEKGFGSAILNQPSRFIENLGVTETPKGTGIAGVVEDVARSPYLPVPGVGSFVPKTASFVPKLAAGLGDIALGAGMGTAESVARNEGVSPLGVGIGGALGALNPLGRAFKSGADYISDRSVGNQIIKTFQDQLLHGNDEEKVAAKNLLEKYGDDPAKLANKLNEMIHGFTGKVGEETINRAIKRNVKWIDPATPGPLSDEPILRAWTKPASVPPTMLDVFGSSLPGIGSLYAAGKALYNNPHFASDATRVLPKGTSTAIRNLGVGVIGSQRKEQ